MPSSQGAVVFIICCDKVCNTLIEIERNTNVFRKGAVGVDFGPVGSQDCTFSKTPKAGT